MTFSEVKTYKTEADSTLPAVPKKRKIEELEDTPKHKTKKIKKEKVDESDAASATSSQHMEAEVKQEPDESKFCEVLCIAIQNWIW